MNGFIELIDPAVQSVVKGRLTTQQVLMTLVVIIAVVLLFKFFKGVVKIACMVGVIIALVVYLGIATPTQLKGLATDTISVAYEKYQAVTHSIEKDGDEIYIHVGEKRLPLSQIESYKETLSGQVQMLTSEGTFISDDQNLLKFLGELSDQADRGSR